MFRRFVLILALVAITLTACNPTPPVAQITPVPSITVTLVAISPTPTPSAASIPPTSTPQATATSTVSPTPSSPTNTPKAISTATLSMPTDTTTPEAISQTATTILEAAPILTATGSIPCKPAQVAAEPAYKDPDVCLAERVEDLLARMTLAEKIGQMTQAEREEVIETDIGDKFIGAMLSGGGSTPVLNTPEAWVELVNRYQEYALQTRLGIPLMYGIDAVHGHNAVVGAVVFPHNVGLGATRDPDLVERIGRVTAEEMAATGIHWNFAPVVAVPQDIRWGRIYEGYSENTELVSTLAAAYIRGLQNIDGRPNLGHPLTVLATPKHFVGDGGTRWGSSTSHDYQIDQGITDVDEATLRAIHLPPYLAALDTGVKVIMASYSSWGGMKMHAQKYLLTGVLKEELGFTGFLLSDWEAIEQIPGDYYHDTVTAVNAGVDMNMAPSNYNLFIKSLTQAVQRGDVPMERIDEAVRRILAVKFELGLFERPLADKALAATVGSAKHRAVGREAVRKSLVLLKNDNQTLPLAKETPLILVAGRAADDIGIQCGGWTIEWQGKVGEITTGTTILEAIQNTVSAETTVEYDPAGLFEPATSNGQPPRADVGIVVVGETPYAEGEGDKADLALSPQDIAAIERVKQRSQKLVVILISGRPMIITDQLSQADAFVAAWLPGTEGQGVADVLFGVYPFTGKLPYTWPRSMDQLPLNSNMNSTTEPLFPFGYGLEF